MKKLIFSKFFKDTTSSFIIAIITLSLIVWVIQAVNFLDFVTEDGHGLEVYFKFTLLNLPKIISKIMPLIFFTTLFYILNKYEDNNELKIFWINGIDKRHFINEVIKFSFIFLILQFFTSSLLVPTSQNKARTYIQSSNIEFFPSLINEKKFIDTVENLTIYIEKKNGENQYENIYLKDIDQNNKIKIIIAKNGNLINKKNERSLNLYEGKIININQNEITTFNFSETVFDLSKYLTKSIVDFKIQEKKTYNLISCNINYHLLKKEEFYDVNNCNKDSEVMMKEEIFKRIFKPFYFIAIGLSACFLLIFSKENNNNKINRFLVFIFGVLILIISEMSASFSGKSNLQFIFSIFLPLTIFLIQYVYLNLKFKGPNI